MSTVPNTVGTPINVSVSVIVPVANWLAVKLTPAINVTGCPSTAGFGEERTIVTLATGAATLGAATAPSSSKLKGTNALTDRNRAVKLIVICLVFGRNVTFRDTGGVDLRVYSGGFGLPLPSRYYQC